MITARRIALSLVISASIAGTAAAADRTILLASLGDINGKVLVNKGKGFVSAKPGMDVRPGDRIVTLDNASAKVVFNNGCVTSLKENSVLGVDGKGCDTKPLSSRSKDIVLAAAIGEEPSSDRKVVAPIIAGGGGPSLGVLGGFGALGLGVIGNSIANDKKSVSGQ